MNIVLALFTATIMIYTLLATCMFSSYFCEIEIETKTTYTSVFPSLKRLQFKSFEIKKKKKVRIQNINKKLDRIIPMNSFDNSKSVKATYMFMSRQLTLSR